MSLTEALKRIEVGIEKGFYLPLDEDFITAVNAARWFSLWFVECPTCNGHGMVTYADASTALERTIMHACPDCTAGWVPRPEAVDAMASPIWNESNDINVEAWREIMRAGLLGLLEMDKQ